MISGVTTAPALPDQRDRILDHALTLMAETGVHAMSMRKLAGACGLNVATIYHYFPSKEALVAEVVAHKNYAELLNQVPPVDPTLAPPDRLAALLRWVWGELSDHDAIWKLRSRPPACDPTLNPSTDQFGRGAAATGLPPLRLLA